MWSMRASVTVGVSVRARARERARVSAGESGSVNVSMHTGVAGSFFSFSCVRFRAPLVVPPEESPWNACASKRR